MYVYTYIIYIYIKYIICRECAAILGQSTERGGSTRRNASKRENNIFFIEPFVSERIVFENSFGFTSIRFQKVTEKNFYVRN